MIEVSNCVICDGEIRRLKPALVAPFLATRIWNRPPFCVNLVQCKACGFMFYNPRLDAAEEGRLYAGYRSQEYWRMRHASEPWYTGTFNFALASPGAYELHRRLPVDLAGEGVQPLAECGLALDRRVTVAECGRRRPVRFATVESWSLPAPANRPRPTKAGWCAPARRG